MPVSLVFSFLTNNYPEHDYGLDFGLKYKKNYLNTLLDVSYGREEVDLMGKVIHLQALLDAQSVNDVHVHLVAKVPEKVFLSKLLSDYWGFLSYIFF